MDQDLKPIVHNGHEGLSVVTVGGPRPFTCAAWPGREVMAASIVAANLGIPLTPPISASIDRFEWDVTHDPHSFYPHVQPRKVRSYGSS